LVVGCWLLVVGCWLLVVGCWLLVVGCWLLVVGCWLLGLLIRCHSFAYVFCLPFVHHFCSVIFVICVHQSFVFLSLAERSRWFFLFFFDEFGDPSDVLYGNLCCVFCTHSGSSSLFFYFDELKGRMTFCRFSE